MTPSFTWMATKQVTHGGTERYPGRVGALMIKGCTAVAWVAFKYDARCITFIEGAQKRGREQKIIQS